MADYNKTPQVVAQVAELKKLMSDGRMMTPDDIMTTLKRKWISSVVYYLGEDVNLETVKDGRKVVGYRISDGAPKTSQSKISDTVSNATAAAKRATKRAEPSTALISDTPEGRPDVVTPTVDMRAVITKPHVSQPKATVIPSKPELPPRDLEKMPLHVWPEDDDLAIPKFLRRT